MSDFDIGLLEVEDVATVELLDVKGDPLVINGVRASVTVYGPGSDQYQRAAAKLQATMEQRLMQAAKGKAKDDVEESRKRNAERLTALTHSIDGLPVTPAAFYANPKLGYLHKQVAEYIEDWGNFAKG